jgi:hypothetical protein
MKVRLLNYTLSLSLAYLLEIATKTQRRLFYGPVKLFLAVLIWVEFLSSGSK